MADLNSGWQELIRETGRKCPKLFYNFITNHDGYVLYFTDLIVLWQAQSSVEDIRVYARETRTSIDPGDSAQLKVLLEKLSRSLASGTNALRQTEETGTEALLLSTTLPLPRPLQPLKWDFLLQPKEAAELGEVILRPCLHEAAESRRKVASLIEFIAAKDRVISKLVDKIEGSSVDLSLVFPGITGAKARKGYVTLKEAQSHVPHLAEFKVDQWEKGFESQSPYTTFENHGLYNLVVGNEACPKHTSAQHQRWYSKLPKVTATVSQAIRIDALKSSSPIRYKSDSDEFETQKKKKEKKKILAKSTNLSTTNTDSENEKQGPAQVESMREKLPRLSASSSNIPSSPPPIPRLTSINSIQEIPNSDASDSATESDLDAPPKPKGRLGGLSRRLPNDAKVLRIVSSSVPRSSSPLPIKPSLSSPRSSPPPQLPDFNFTTAESVGHNYIKSPKARPNRSSRLGGMRRGSDTGIQTPESTTAPMQNDIKVSSAQIPPSRHRLDTLRRSKQTSQTLSPPRNIKPIADMMELDPESAAQHSDASTTSAGSDASLDNNPDKPLLTRADTDDSSQRTNLKPDIVNLGPGPVLTKEQRQSQRREELKRKHALTSAATGINANGSAGGLRKKRKF